MSSHGYDKEAKEERYGSPDNDLQDGQISDNADHLHRRLSNRQIQLLAIGGSIGTALFVSIGNGLAAGGPGSLFLAYLLYSLVVACVNNCISEMIILQPVSGGFIRLAGKWFDDALGFMVGWNFFIYEALLIPFEITAINLVLTFWRDDIPVAAVCAALREGDVETLIVGELGDSTVVTGAALTAVAPDADVLSDFGEPVVRVARADEALPFSAIAVGARLVRADNRLTPADGVAALLRYVATDRLASTSDSRQ